MTNKRLCTECESNPRIPGQRVCTTCHANYMRGYRRTSREKLVNRARFEGVEAVLMKLKEMGHADVAEAVGRYSTYNFPVQSREEAA